jgi:multidrug resistance efflux pump
MLNISDTKIRFDFANFRYSTLRKVENKKSSKVLRRLLYVSFAIVLIFLFLPWTQNIRTKGYITTIKPNQKPQTINSIISGQIANWYVQEGDYVNKGDTILKINETKDAYFDKDLINRTKNLIELKKQAIEAYASKIKNQEEQLLILNRQRDFKINQLKNKIDQAEFSLNSDSINFLTTYNNLKIADYQYKRYDSLYKLGLKSLTDLENKRNKYQDANNYYVKAENNFLKSKSEFINAKIELDNTNIKYEADINKIQSDIYSTATLKLNYESELNKLENQLSNYQYRTALYYVIAPQDGFITEITKSGINEYFKEGEQLVSFMPYDNQLAVAIYVKPVDLPLVHKGQKVRLQFDGWPAIVFSGWPNTSHGTYGGEIYAIDQFISNNGKYRVLVKPDSKDYQWPKALKYGGGANALIMLNDVPVWYELWRNINGFPPDFYVKDNQNENKKDKK